jgi:WD40 repeat protein/serine/threonine protein kinase
VKAVFAQACKLTSGVGPYLDEACGDDPIVRAEVEALLGHDSNPNDAFKTPALGVGLSRTMGEVLEQAQRKAATGDYPKSIGKYRILGVLGEGGMGVVFVAEQDRPRRTVALKVIRGGLGHSTIARRFEHEAELLGRLQHPGIAQIYEAGIAETAHGPQAYLAMELIRGRALTDYANAQELTTGERLELVARVCDAVHHAHQRGVIHRDLKPGNILVEEQAGLQPTTVSQPGSAHTRTSHGARSSHGYASQPSHTTYSTHGSSSSSGGRVGQPKILDFGVARAMNADLAITTFQTSVGQLIGTLPYMSPEQIVADPAEIDTRSDIYALGVIAYQLLTGKLPHDLGSRSIPEAARMIRDARPASLSSINKSLRGEVETIVSKAMEKDKDRRYQSAADLAEDIRRHLRREPILARQDSALYVLRSQLRRYRHLVAIGIAGVIALAVFAAYAGWSARTERLLRNAAASEAARATAEAGRATAEASRADAEAGKLREALYFNRIGFAQASYLSLDIDRMKRSLAACEPEARGWEWRYLSRLSERSTRTVKATDSGWGYFTLGLPASGAPLVLSYSVTGPPRLWDWEKGEVLRTWADWGLVTAFLSPDARYVAVTSGDSGTLVIRDPLTGEIVRSVPDVSKTGLGAVSFSRDGSRMAVNTAEGAIAIVGADGRVIATSAVLGPGQMGFPSFDHSGARVAVGMNNGKAFLVDASTGEVIRGFTGHTAVPRSVDFSPDDKRLVSASMDKTVRVWDVETGALLSTLRHHNNKVFAACWLSDGRTIASTGTEPSIVLTDAETGEHRGALCGHALTVQELFLWPGTNRLMSLDREGFVKAWDEPQKSETPSIDAGGSVTGLAVHPRDGRVAIVSTGGKVLVMNAEETGVAASVPLRERLWSVDWRPNAGTLVAGGDSGTIYRVDPGTGSFERGGAKVDSNVLHVRFSASGDALATVSRDFVVRIMDPMADRVLASWKPDGVNAGSVEWSPDGAGVLVGHSDGSVGLYDREGKLLKRADLKGVYVQNIVRSPDGVLYAVSCEDNAVHLIRTSDLSEVRVLRGHMGGIFDAAFSPDSSRVVSGSFDNMAKVWDVKSGEELVTLRGHTLVLSTARFSLDGNLIYTGNYDRLVKVWDGRPGDAGAGEP